MFIRILFGRILFGVTLGAVLAVGTMMPAQALVYIGAKKDWHVFTEQDPETGLVCYMATSPTRSSPDDVTHGDTFVIVAHRPQEQTRNVISVVLAYELDANRPVTANIGGREFSLLADGNKAWAPDPLADEELVAAMKRGLEMIVSMTSLRGTGTEYSFSLSGATAALREIDQACGY